MRSDDSIRNNCDCNKVDFWIIDSGGSSTHGIEVTVLQGLAREDTLGVVVDQHLAQQVQRLLAAEGLVVRFDHLRPGLGGHSKW